jgi:hypothetical protein
MRRDGVDMQVETTHIIRVCGVDEADGLVTVNQLGEFPMEEGVLDVKLAYPPDEGEGDREDDVDGGRFDNRDEGLVEFDAVLLRKTVKDPTSLVAVESTIGLELLAKHLPETMFALAEGERGPMCCWRGG